MKIEEVTLRLTKENSNLFFGIPPKKAKAIVRAVLTCIREVIDATPEGIIKIEGFGGFHVRQVEREVAGEKINRKVVVFRAAQTRKSDTI
jgi:nucleoid DNA-binding protein